MSEIATYEKAMEMLPKFFEMEYAVSKLPRQIVPGVVKKNADSIEWAIDNGLDEPYNAEFLEGVVLALVHGRTAFAHAHGAGPSSGAICQSYDRVTGFGTPGGSCADCKLSEWGRNPGPDQPRCGTRAWIVMLINGQYLPSVILVPPTSCDPVQKYELALLGTKGLALWNVVTRLRLRGYTTQNGRTVSQIIPRLGSYESPITHQAGLDLNNAIVADLRRSIVAGVDTVTT